MGAPPQTAVLVLCCPPHVATMSGRSLQSGRGSSADPNLTGTLILHF